ncbi:Serine/threonine-protein kinase PknK [compost metagenome]
MQEVDAQSLALDAEELERLLAQRRLELSGDVRERLLQHSSGWPAGIGLLLLDGNADGLAQRIAAGTPLLSEYLEREVLAGLPDSLREALDTLAHMPRFNAALCEHLLEGRDGMEALHTLQCNLLFLENVDNRGEWFRLWRPLADTLKRLAGRRAPLQAHLRACQWFASRGEIREAVEHALHAEQPETAISLLQRYGNDQMMIGQSAQQFLQWREELPGELFAGSPQLILRNAWALIICARLDEVDACMQNMARFLPQPSARCQQQLLAHYQTVVGVVQRQRGLPSARQNCLEALAALSERAWAQRILCLQSLAQQAMAEGDLDTARGHVQEGLRLSRQHGNRLFEALLSVENIHLLGMRGEHERALILAEQILQDMPAIGQQGPMMARLRLLRGCLLAVRGDDEKAREELESGVAAAERCSDAYLLFGYLVRFLLAIAEGDLAQAQYLLCKAERQMQCLQVPQVFYRDVLQLSEARLCLEQGNPESALAGVRQVLRQLDEQSLLAPLGFYDIRLRTRLLGATATLRLDRPNDAVAELRTLLEDCRRSGYHSLASECHLLLAEALHLAGLSAEADSELLRAVAECERLGMAQPLRALQRRQPDWLGNCLAPRLAEPRWQALLQMETVDNGEARQDSPLSSRETAVLELIAQGCSNREIAERLRISLHTVKTHARRINVKLGLERRTQAVAMAKAEGWLRT